MKQHHSLKILIVEDEFLIAMDLELVLQELGHVIVGIASTYDEAVNLAAEHKPDLALVDIHLADGPTGIAAASQINRMGIRAVITSANIARIPENYEDAIGSIAKPYSQSGMRDAVAYLARGLLDPPPPKPAPHAIRLSKSYALLWAA